MSFFHNRKLPIRDFELNVSYQGSAAFTNTIVFLHDSLGCISLWRDFPERLGQAIQHNVLIYDRRGYGLSAPLDNAPRPVNYMETEAGILVELLDQCNLPQVTLFGHSDGGTIALLAAAKYPERIKAVITEGAHVFVEEITLDGILRAKEQYAAGLKERLEKYHGNNTQALFDAWTKTWLSEEYLHWNIEHFLPKIQCPALVVQGTEDEYGTEAQVRAIANQVSGPSEICMVVNAGHSPHKQSVHWLIEQCCVFLDKYHLLTGA